MNLNDQIFGVNEPISESKSLPEQMPATEAIEQASSTNPASITEASDVRLPETTPQTSEASTGISTVGTSTAETSAVESSTVADDATKYVTLLFNDGLDMPIQGLEVFVTLPSGEVCMATSTAQGAITVPMPLETQGEARVEVKDHTDKRQQVCTLDVTKCHDAVTIRSPKVVTQHTLRPHQQAAPTNTQNVKQIATTANHSNHTNDKPSQTIPAKVDLHTPWWVSNGAWAHAKQWLKETLHIDEHHQPSHQPIVAETLNKAGNPIAVVVGGECPNKDNLSLGRNNIYRAAIMEGAKRLGLIPQALCALINCEAAKVKELVPKLGPDGKPLKDKHGKLMQSQINKLWNPNSIAKKSSARGLTQFLDLTWLSCCLAPQYYIHQKCVENGWVKQEADKKGKKHWVFVLADGETTTNKPIKHKSDAYITKCLNMRFDPTWSILAAADLGKENLLLAKANFNLSKLSDMDMAKIMYLYHHEGPTGTMFIKNQLGSAKGGLTKLKETFVSQVGLESAEAKIKQAGGDVELAYRFWFAKFIDDKFDGSTEYFCINPLKSLPLSDILVNISGEKIHELPKKQS